MLALYRFVSSFTARLALGFAAVVALGGCGSGTTFEPLVPSRIVSFGDGWSDVGQTGSKYTVNDGSVNLWVERVAASYSRTITASASGGLGFARGGARVNTGANSIADQITAFLAANTIGASDLLIIDAGISELAALAVAHPTDAALTAAADSAGKALAAQVQRLTAAGAKHVVIANAMDLGKTPLARVGSLLPQRLSAYSAASRAFNDGLKIALADVTNNILLIDNEAYINVLYLTPTLIGSNANITAPACSVPVTSCTASNAVSNYSVYLFADDRHITPAAHRLLGDNAVIKIKNRW